MSNEEAASADAERATVLPLFVYGSLRDPHVRAQLLGDHADLTTRPATLRGHARQMVAAFDYPFIVPAAPGDTVDGEIILGLLVSDFAVLDRYEDVDGGLYTRVRVTVETVAGAEDAWTYLKGPHAPS